MPPEHDFLDVTGEPMAADERAFWEDAATCCLSAHMSVPDSHPHPGVVQSAFAWADMAVIEYRKRLRDKGDRP